MGLILSGLLQFTDPLEPPALKLAPGQCVRGRHKEAPCQLCFNACPTQAITAGNPVALDVSRCVDCGLCLHLCPTEAFTRPDNRVGKLLNVLGSLDDGRIEFACPQKNEIALTQANVATIVEVKSCLAAISVSTLVAAVAQWQTRSSLNHPAMLWLNDEPCQDCPIGSVQSEIVRTVEAANQLLAAMGNESKVMTYRGAPGLLHEKTKKRPVEQGNRPRYARRGFFRSLISSADDRLDDSSTDTISSRQNAKEKVNGRTRLLASRNSLVNSLRRLGQSVEHDIDMTGLPFGSVSIEGECVACGLCARFCPSETLAFKEEEGEFSIDFSTTGCVGCTICTLICPTKAVEMKPIIEMDRLLDGTTQTLISGALAECKKCGMSCAANQDELLCFVCQWRNTIPIADVYGRLDNA